MRHGPPHGVLHVLALVNNGARLSEMAIPSPQHKVQEEAVDLAGDRNSIPVAVLCWATASLPRAECLLGLSRKRDVRCNREVLNSTEGVHINRVSAFERMSIFDKAGPDPKVRATS